jgi:hypothetical protein
MEGTMRRLGTIVIVAGLLFGSVGMGSAQSPSLEISGPAEGSTVEGTDVTVTFQVSGISIVPSPVPLEQAGQQPEANRPGEGHLHLMLDLGSLVVWSETTPYTFTNIPPGEHQLMVEIVNNDHSSLTPPVVRQVRFRTSASQVMPNTGVERSARPMSEAGLLAAIGLLIVGAGLVLRRRAA